MSDTTSVARTFCRLCEVGCGLTATVENGQLAKLRPDHDHPVTRGFACAKGLRAGEVHADPDRLRSPLRRGADGFETVSWDDALSGIAEELTAIIERHGPRSVGLYLGNPNAFNALSSATTFFFTAMLGSDRMFSAATQDCSNKYAVSELMYGTRSAHAIPDVDRTDLLLVIGSNPRVSGSSFWSVADPVANLRGVRDRGGRVVFVNPVAIEPDIGSTLQVRPGTDAYLLAALVHEIHRTVGFDLGALEGQVNGLDDVVRFVEAFAPEDVAPVVGLDAGTIVSLAESFAAADGASIHCSTGLNMSRHGAVGYWLVQVLLLVTGNLDAPGGNFFAARGLAVPPSPVDRSLGSFEDGGFGPFRRVVGMLPAAVLPDLIADDHEPLRALVVVAGNPAISVGGGRVLEESLSSLDLLVSIDLYRNATAELAHYVLPATDQFEREDVNLFVQGVQSEPFVQWTPAVCVPDGEQRPEWQILGDLLIAMGHDPVLDPTTEDPLPLLLDGILPDGLTVASLRSTGGVAVISDSSASTLDRANVVLPIECVAEGLVPSLERTAAIFREDADPGALERYSLITRRTRDGVNSSLRNVQARRESVAPNPLWMHPDDATELGLSEGSGAAVRNRWGSLEAVVAFDGRLRRGVVAMTHGFGGPQTVAMATARASHGVNVNELAPHGPGSFDPVSSMSHITAIPVDISALEIVG